MFKRLWIFLTLALFAAPSFAIGVTIVSAITLVAFADFTVGMLITAAAINMVVSAAVSFAFSMATQPDSGSFDSGSSGTSPPDTGNRLQVAPNTANKLPVIYGSAWTGGTITDMSITQNNQVLYYVISLCEVTGSGEQIGPIYDYDRLDFGDIYYGGKKVIFQASGYSYSNLGAMSAVGANYVEFDLPPVGVAVGNYITFAESDSATPYTVLTIVDNRITFATNISGASVGGSAYIRNYDPDYAANVVGLRDESTGVLDEAVKNKIKIYLYRNGSNEPANCASTATAVMSDPNLVYKWPNTNSMTACAFAIIRLQYSVSANIRGINQTKFQIINERTKPGDCVLDYMRSSRYGCAIPVDQIDTVSLDALNAYSDETITYTSYSGVTETKTRYRFNGQLSTDRNCMDNLQDMMNCCDSILKYNEIVGLWAIIVNKATYTVAENVNDSNMVSSLTITPLDIAASYNYIEVKFPDETNQDAFNTANFDLAQIAPELLYPNEPVNKVSVNLPYVNDDVRAQIIANRMLKSSREDLQVTVQVNFVGLQYEAGDVVTVTNANYGWVDKLFRLTKVTETFSDDGAIIVKLVMSEFNPSVYDDVSVTQFSPAPNSGISDPTFFGTPLPPVIAAEYATAVTPSIVVTVKTPAAGITQYMEVWYSAYANPNEDQMYFAGTTEVQSNGTPWTVNYDLPNVIITNMPAGNWYLFTRAVNSLATSTFSSHSVIIRWRPATYQFTAKYLAVAYANSITGTGFSLNPSGKSYYGLCNQENTSVPMNASAYTWFLAEPTFGTSYYLCFCNRQSRKFSFDTGLAAYAAGSGAFVPTVASLFDPSIWSALPTGLNIIDLDHRTGQLIETGTTTVGTGEIAVRNTSDGRVVAALQQYLDFGAGVYTYTGSVATLTIDIYGRVVGFEPPDDFYYTRQTFTATAGQTVFSVTRGAGYIVGQCFVFVNGDLIKPTTDYTDAAGAVTLTTGVPVGTTVTVISFKSTNSSAGVYASFTRQDVSLTEANSYTPTSINSGYELLFINGVLLTEIDYDIVDGVITNFPSPVTGNLTIIEWQPNNLNQPNGTPVNILAYTVSGQALYSFSYDANAFNVYENGVQLTQGTDFTTSTGTYTLSPTPNSTNVLVQQTFARTGAV